MATGKRHLRMAASRNDCPSRDECASCGRQASPPQTKEDVHTIPPVNLGAPQLALQSAEILFEPLLFLHEARFGFHALLLHDVGQCVCESLTARPHGA